jgi:hypothetical protein
MERCAQCGECLFAKYLRFLSFMPNWSCGMYLLQIHIHLFGICLKKSVVQSTQYEWQDD